MRQQQRAATTAAAAIALACALACAPPAADPAPVFAPMAQRLLLMEEVARAKLHSGAPVEDLAREAVVLQRALGAAAQFGLQTEGVARLTRAQMEAAKAVQRGFLKQWRAAPESNVAPRNLAEEIRPQLLHLGAAVNRAAAEFLREGGRFAPPARAQFMRAMQTVPHLTEAHKQELFAALSALQLAPDARE